MKNEILFPGVMVALLACAVTGNAQKYNFSVFAGCVGKSGCADCTGTNALFNHPMGLAVDAAGNLYVADNGNGVVRLIQPDGVVSTYANLQLCKSSAQPKNSSSGTCFSFNSPIGIAVDASGTLYVSDSDTIYKVSGSPANAVVDLLAGGKPGYRDGLGTTAEFRGAYGLAVDGSGTVWVADQQNKALRTITTNGLVGTAYINPSGPAHGNSKPTSLTQDQCQFTGVAAGVSTNVFLMDQSAYVGLFSPLCDSLTNLWHCITQTGCSSGIAVDVPGNIYVYDGNKTNMLCISRAGLATSLGALPVKGADIEGIAVDSFRNIYIADRANNVILKGSPEYPQFFANQEASSAGVYYMTFTNGTPFGCYNLGSFSFPIFYHFNMGFEYFFDANDGQGGGYLYDFTSGTFWYTSPSIFPYLYDFTLNAWLYYYPDTNNPGNYTSNPRYFYDFGSSQIITK